MRRAIFIAMCLSLWRDRAAFALTFLLPPLIYIIFAAVFSSAASGDVSIRLGVQAPEDEISQEIVEGLSKSVMVSALTDYMSTQEIRTAVLEGDVDAAIAITREGEASVPTFKIYYDPIKAGAAAMAEAALAAQQPDFTNDDEEEEEEDEAARFSPAEKIIVSANNPDAENQSKNTSQISMATYYVAGVGMLFLFLSGFQTALSVIEERDSGILERIAAGPYGIRPMIDGKFAFLVVQGIGQFVVLFLVSHLVFDISLSQSPIALLTTIIAASISAAGLCLAIVGCCRTRSQAHAVGAVLALTMGALGGSMAPRFLMSPEIRAIGAFTPNAWGIDAFGLSLWRGGTFEALISPWALLIISGIIGLGFSYFMMQKTLRAL